MFGLKREQGGTGGASQAQSKSEGDKVELTKADHEHLLAAQRDMVKYKREWKKATDQLNELTGDGGELSRLKADLEKLKGKGKPKDGDGAVDVEAVKGELKREHEGEVARLKREHTKLVEALKREHAIDLALTVALHDADIPGEFAVNVKTANPDLEPEGVAHAVKVFADKHEGLRAKKEPDQPRTPAGGQPGLRPPAPGGETPAQGAEGEQQRGVGKPLSVRDATQKVFGDMAKSGKPWLGS